MSVLIIYIDMDTSSNRVVLNDRRYGWSTIDLLLSQERYRSGGSRTDRGLWWYPMKWLWPIWYPLRLIKAIMAGGGQSRRLEGEYLIPVIRPLYNSNIIRNSILMMQALQQLEREGKSRIKEKNDDAYY